MVNKGMKVTETKKQKSKQKISLNHKYFLPFILFLSTHLKTLAFDLIDQTEFKLKWCTQKKYHINKIGIIVRNK